MTSDQLIKLLRVGMSCSIVVAISAQLYTAQPTPANFLSYFTVLSNLIVAGVLLLTAFIKTKHPSVDVLRGMATLYILITGLGFSILLNGRDDELLGWVNFVLHYASPLFMLGDWLVTPVRKIAGKETLPGVIFPILYVLYTLIRGHITGWYPYAFLNPNEVGAIGVFTYLSAFALASGLLTVFLLKRTR